MIKKGSVNINSILAGTMIGLGAIINLTLGGVLGAIFFSLGLMTIITFKFDLFTGKAGLLATQEITWQRLVGIWFGNFLGTFIVSFGILMTPQGEKIAVSAMPIVEARVGNHPIENIVLGIFCGVLMYIAVQGFALSNNVLFIIMPVAVFILSGYNHCVADMATITLGCTKLSDYLTLIPTTIGNVIGCNAIGVAKRYI